jgi:hypothetical protein
MKTRSSHVQAKQLKQKYPAGEPDRCGRVRLCKTGRIVSVLFCLGLLSFVCAPSLPAQPESSADGVTVKNGEPYCLRGEQLEALTENIKLPLDIEVNTNGCFKVGKGKERKLEEGQVLRRDGWLLNPDGSVWPAFDYVAMKEGKVIAVRDGEADTLTEAMVFPNKLTISPDGMCAYPDGNRMRLVDGQLFRLDGTAILAKDTVTLKNGRVVVQKSGKLITLLPDQIVGMNDGTRIQGDGTIHRRDGSIIPLQEGKTVTVEGVAAPH